MLSLKYLLAALVETWNGQLARHAGSSGEGSGLRSYIWGPIKNPRLGRFSRCIETDEKRFSD